ncbi:hypothetical protein FHG89_11505 [Micromonospora orduensis]|uniref:Transglutaminase-like domain-containing protein n=1 Tax=Micromonospora orduensis TaxID=1420891 RepID=A0A5C4QUV2_9ACTN|nr:hypothetical protein [Micromonospora orduensis]TNH29627.1 hypothetical protein FHG89_11505 [Micromonospora orduensis]
MTRTRLDRAGPIDWEQVLSRVVLVDDARRRATVSARRAQEFLRLAPDELDRLTAAGLPGANVGGELRYDFRDLYNVGLYAGFGTSQAEQALQVMMRFASRPVEQLLTPRRWTVQIRGECAACRDGGAPEGTWQVQQPDPFPGGGRLLSWQVRPGLARPAPSAGATSPAGHLAREPRPPDLLVEGVVETIGVRRQIRSSRILAEIERFSALNLRWHLLTEEQWPDIERFHRLGVTDCVMASLYLAERMTRLGIEAQTRCGWMTGIVNVSHGWLEVRDEDGAIKTVDLILPQLAGLLAPGSGAYRQLASGSLINRVIRADCPADQPLVTHRHGAGPVDVDLLTEVRPVLDRREQS